MGSVKQSVTHGLDIVLLNGERLQIEFPRDTLNRLRNSNKVFNSYLHLVTLSVEDNGLKPTTRNVYYNFGSQNIESLDDIRLQIGKQNLDFGNEMRNTILKGLINIYYLVSEGKIYNVPINPLNFIMKEGRNIQAFYRNDHELGEITDEFMTDFKKLLAYFMIADTEIIAEKFEEYTTAELVKRMPSTVLRSFERIYRCATLPEMLEIIQTDKQQISSLEGFFPLDDSFNKPINLSSQQQLDITNLLSGNIVNLEPVPTGVSTTIPKSSTKKGLTTLSKSSKKDNKLVKNIKDPTTLSRKEKKALQKKNKYRDLDAKFQKHKEKTTRGSTEKKAIVDGGSHVTMNKILLIFIILLIALGFAFLGNLIYPSTHSSKASMNKDFTVVYSQHNQTVSKVQ